MASYYLLNQRMHSYWWFEDIRTNLRFIPSSVWAEKVSKTNIFMLNRTQAILIKWKTSLECQGMNSRVFSKKVENPPKWDFEKIALELNPYIQDKNFMRVLLKHLLIENEHQKYKFMQFMLMSVFHKNHKPEVENELTMVPWIFCFPNSLLLLYLFSRIYFEFTIFISNSLFFNNLFRESTLNPLFITKNPVRIH